MNEVLNGVEGARREMTLLNSGAALMVSGMVSELSEGIEMAADCIDSGKADKKLKQLKEVTQTLAT